jgi:hypothetical protein
LAVVPNVKWERAVFDTDHDLSMNSIQLDKPATPIGVLVEHRAECRLPLRDLVVYREDVLGCPYVRHVCCIGW